MENLNKYPNINKFKTSIKSINKRGHHWEILFIHNGARTLEPSIGFDEKSGWTVDAEIQEDYYTWINYFEAYKNNKRCYVKGDFESIIETSSLKTLDDFLSYYNVYEWDYSDI